MNQEPKKEIRVVEDQSPIAYLMDTAHFEHLQRVSKLMAMASLTPKHLQGTSPEQTLANCFRVVNQALRWGFEPFAVADETYVVHGRLGYQGKLVAAVINARAGLTKRLSCSYAGAGNDRTITISGQFSGEDQPRIITLSVAQAKTDNQMWIRDPDQKLWYSGVIKWARRHCPEIILGVLTDDELDRISQEPPKESPREYGSRTEQVAARIGSQVRNVQVADQPTAEMSAKESRPVAPLGQPPKIVPGPPVPPQLKHGPGVESSDDF